MSVSGQVVLVTGAARGMGREYVRTFLAEGARVIATDLSWVPSGASSDDYDFLAEIQDNPNVLADVRDITIDSHIDRVFEAAMAKFGTLDVMINNAGLRQRDLYPPHGSVTLLETRVGDWQRMFDTHVFGTVRVIQRFIKPMLGKHQGSIVNICSGGYTGHRPNSREMPYMSAKAALANLTLYLAEELKPENIAVNVLIPGHTRTTGSDEQEEARSAMRAERGPSFTPRRVRPDNPVHLALFLAEQDASGTTGEVLNAVEWNQQQELGGFEVWGHGPDVEAARAAGRL